MCLALTHRLSPQWSGSLFEILAEFNVGMSNFDIPSPIKAFVIDVLGSRGMERATEKFLALLTENVGVLPEEIGPLLSSANVYGQLKHAELMMTTLQTSNVIEGTEVLVASYKVHSVIGSKPEFRLWRQNASERWREGVANIVAASLTQRAADDYIEKHRGLEEAIQKWEFDGVFAHYKLPGDHPENKKILKEGEVMDRLVIGTPTTIRTLNTIEPMLSDLDWAPNEKAQLGQAVAMKANLERKADSVAFYMSCGVVLSAILSAAPKDLIKYCSRARAYVTNRIKYDMIKLPASLTKKLDEAAIGQPETSSASSAAPQRQSAGETNSQPQGPQRRRITPASVPL